MIDERNNIIEEEEDVITLEFDDGTAVDCFVMGTFEAEGKEYIALEPDDGTDDVYIYSYAEGDDETFEINEIDDESEFNKAVAVFDELMQELDISEEEN